MFPNTRLAVSQKANSTAPQHAYTEQLTNSGILALPLVFRVLVFSQPAVLLQLMAASLRKVRGQRSGRAEEQPIFKSVDFVHVPAWSWCAS